MLDWHQTPSISSANLNPQHIYNLIHPQTMANLEASVNKQVRIHPLSMLRVYHTPGESDASGLYYSNDEYDEMKARRAHDVRALHRKYLKLSSSKEAIKDLDYTGLENCLTPELAERVAHLRDSIRCAVLLEQARQKQLGIHSPLEIAYVAQNYSRASVRYARKLGALTARDVVRG